MVKEGLIVFGHMNILTLRVMFVSCEAGRLPAFLGSTIRGLIGHAMYRFQVPLARSKEFGKNSFIEQFSTSGNAGGAVNGYALRVETKEKVEWKEGDICQFDLTLIGSMSEQAGVFLDALQEMDRMGWGAQRIKFQLLQVTNLDTGRLIWHGGKTWLRNMQSLPLDCPENPANIAVFHFCSPTRLLASSQLIQAPTFAHIVESLSRRLSLLSEAYTDTTINFRTEEMLAAAKKVETTKSSLRVTEFKRYSMNRHDHKLPLSGIEGIARYEGDLTSFTSLLEAGRKINIGKNATHGFGYYEVYYV